MLRVCYAVTIRPIRVQLSGAFDGTPHALPTKSFLDSAGMRVVTRERAEEEVDAAHDVRVADHRTADRPAGARIEAADRCVSKSSALAVGLVSDQALRLRKLAKTARLCEGRAQRCFGAAGITLLDRKLRSPSRRPVRKFWQIVNPVNDLRSNQRN